MIEQFLSFLTQMSTNKFFMGCTLILMNIGSRYVIGDLNKVHEALLQSEVAKKIVLFCICFVGSRDIMTAIMLTFAFSFIIKCLLNVQSKFNILPQKLVTSTHTISKIEYEKAKKLVTDYEKETFTNTPASPDSYKEYSEIISKLQKLKH